MLNLANIYQPGTFCTIKGIWIKEGVTYETWVIVSVRIELVESDNPLKTHEMTQMLTIAAVDIKGDEWGEEHVTINSDMYDIVEH